MEKYHLTTRYGEIVTGQAQAWVKNPYIIHSDGTTQRFPDGSKPDVDKMMDAAIKERKEDG